MKRTAKVDKAAQRQRRAEKPWRRKACPLFCFEAPSDGITGETPVPPGTAVQSGMGVPPRTEGESSNTKTCGRERGILRRARGL